MATKTKGRIPPQIEFELLTEAFAEQLPSGLVSDRGRRMPIHDVLRHPWAFADARNSRTPASGQQPNQNRHPTSHGTARPTSGQEQKRRQPAPVLPYRWRHHRRYPGLPHHPPTPVLRSPQLHHSCLPTLILAGIKTKKTDSKESAYIMPIASIIDLAHGLRPVSRSCDVAPAPYRSPLSMTISRFSGTGVGSWFRVPGLKRYWLTAARTFLSISAPTDRMIFRSEGTPFASTSMATTTFRFIPATLGVHSLSERISTVWMSLGAATPVETRRGPEVAVAL